MLRNWLKSAYRLFKQTTKPTAYQILQQHSADRYSLYASMLKKGKLSPPVVSKTPVANSSGSFINLQVTDKSAPLLITADDARYLSPLSTDPWPAFVNQLSGNVYCTIGYRKAFFPSSPLPFFHAVIIVSDAATRHAIFGYNSPFFQKRLCIVNDMARPAASLHYLLDDKLTIKGEPSQVQQLFAEMEKRGGKMTYTLFTNNCYTPLISALLDAKQWGFKVPKGFNKQLLIKIPSEQNFGLGVTTNLDLRERSQVAEEKVIAKFKPK